MLNDIRLKDFHLSKEQDGCQLSTLLFNIMLEVLAIAIRKKKEIKDIQIRKEGKLSLFAYNMILYVENAKDSIQELLEAINKFGKLPNPKSTYRK